MNFSGKFGSDQIIWYPASGDRNMFDGTLIGVGVSGSYWSASPLSHDVYYLRFGSVNVIPLSSSCRAYSSSVRCLQVID